MDIPGWDRRRCLKGGCWAKQDGGWAEKLYDLWTLCATREDVSGRWTIDTAMLQVCLVALTHPAVEMADDPFDCVRALRLCAGCMNNPEGGLSYPPAVE